MVKLGLLFGKHSIAFFVVKNNELELSVRILNL